jgi:hypothetical protein
VLRKLVCVAVGVRCGAGALGSGVVGPAAPAAAVGARARSLFRAPVANACYPCDTGSMRPLSPIMADTQPKGL